MKQTLLFFCLFFSMVLFFSCKDKKDDGTLLLSTGKLEFAAEGSSEKLEIVTEHDWFVDSEIEWISFVPTSGSGNSPITVVAVPNKADTVRNAAFYIKAGNLTEEVVVSQKGTYLTTDSLSLLFDREGTPKEVNITSRYSWTIDLSGAEWCEVSPITGTGDQTIIITPLPVTERYPRHNDKIKISCNGSDYYIVISQDVENTAPTAPVLVYPENQAILEGTYPYFYWLESEDIDGDEIFYQIYIAENSSGVWEKLHVLPISETSYYLDYTNTGDKKLKENTVYHWKVLAYDNYWGGETESESFSFTTGVTNIHANGDILEMQISAYSDKTTPIVVFIGDGFIKSDYTYGGLFDIMADIAYETFFSVEPYPTYKNYFDVYKIIAYSEESGATVLNDFYEYDVPAGEKNTLFKSSFEGGDRTDIRCETKDVFAYVIESLQKEIPDFEDADLDRTTIVLLINLDVYSGTTTVSRTGRSIAMCPIGRETFREVICHEGAGHGFGRLLDEYIDFPSLTIEEEAVERIEEYRDGDPWWLGANISFTGERSEIHWSHYIDKPGYEVGILEGGYRFGLGVWHPEVYSCMFDNLFYFNAPSREAIVRRLMKITGEEFDWDDFYAKDIIKKYTTIELEVMRTKASRQTKRVPLAPPLLIP